MNRRRLWLVLLGLIVVAPIAIVDPSAAFLLFDVDFVVVMGTVGLAYLRGDAAVALRWLATSFAGACCRAGVALTRDDPRSLLAR